MKKLLTLSNLIKICAAVFGLVAFFLMFANQLYAEILGNRAYVEFGDALFGDYGSVISFIGYLIIGISSICIIALLFIDFDEKIKKFAGFGLAVLLILGAVFVFIVASVVNGNIGFDTYHAAAAPIIAGIFAIIAALAVIASEFAPNKSLLK